MACITYVTKPYVAKPFARTVSRTTLVVFVIGVGFGVCGRPAGEKDILRAQSRPPRLNATAGLIDAVANPAIKAQNSYRIQPPREVGSRQSA
jgi:hypothetical protein